MRTTVFLLIVGILSNSMLGAEPAKTPAGDGNAKEAAKPAAPDKPLPPTPTLANVHYGDHERQVLDFWKAESSQPTPLLFFIHGGGWVNGDKSGVGAVDRYLKAGISVVSINYRYVTQAIVAGVKPPVDWPLHDAARALQFVRSKAAEWNIDKARIGATGGSAGACSSLWLAFHNDMADPNSADPVARESTRLWCAAVDGAQTTLDPQQMKEWTPNSRYGGHAFGFMPDPADKTTRDTQFSQFLAARETILPWIKEYSPLELVTADDPPIYLHYSAAPALGQEQKDPTHTANFGVKLAEKLKTVGVPCELVYPGVPDIKHRSSQEYLIDTLKAAKPAQAQITIDAGKTGTPISKYVYGQFIEHLGHCIYGGIWAEMLEDRKFFDAVGSPQSPWKAIGPADCVRMDRQQPFVGDQSPRIALAGRDSTRGLVQTALALRAGKQYVGRIWLGGSAAAGPVSVRLIWGNEPNQRQTVVVEKLSAAYAKTPLEFTAGGDTDEGRLEITAAGEGEFSVGTVSLMPADNIQGMRADTLALLKELDSPVYRWPGGNFVSGYNWNDGIGDRDRRPPRKNPAWKGIEHNDFGLDEFMVLCRWLKTEPYIAVNSGQGDVSMAVAELQYANAPADAPGGRRRAENGHAEPYGVKWWSIGNEMYGDWQLGYMPLEKYEQKHNEFAKAMRNADPTIQLIGVGNVGKWTQGMLEHCADSMDLISEHFYNQEIANDLPAHVRQIPDNVRRIADAHREYRKHLPSLSGKNIRIALDEWNYWYGPDIYGEVGVRYFFKDALGVAAGLHEYARQSDIIFMANYAQTVNVLGCIKTTKTAAAMETTALPLMLYRKHFGTIPVTVTVSGPVDVMAAWTPDRKALTIGIVNVAAQPQEIPLQIAGAKLTGAGRRWQITGTDLMAHNEPGKTPAIAISESAVSDAKDRLSVAPYSVSLFSLDVE